MCCRVLVVDDDPRFRALARDVLEHRGCVVVGEVGTGSAARSAAVRLAPDAVLLDVRLPDESGFEVCAALSETAQAPAVLLVSASDYGGCAVVALCGAKGFALKLRPRRHRPRPVLADDRRAARAQPPTASVRLAAS